MSNNISTFSKPGTRPKILQALISREINPEFQKTFVTTPATRYLSRSISRTPAARDAAGAGLLQSGVPAAAPGPAPLRGTPEHHREPTTTGQSKGAPQERGCRFLSAACKRWCFLCSVWSNLIYRLTRRHLATSRAIC